MAASGLLQSDNAIFYHPLNSGAVEFCQDREWVSQFGAYTDTAKIEEGWLGLGNGDPNLANSGIYNSGKETTASDRDSQVAWIDQNRAVIVDRRIEGTDFQSGIVVTHLGNGEFTAGTPVNIDGYDFQSGEGRRNYDVARINASSCIIVHESGAAPGVSGVARVYSVSGDTLTLENSIGFTANNTRYMSTVGITPSSFVILWNDFGASDGRSVVCTVDENYAISLGSTVDFTTNRADYIDVDKLSNSGVVAVYREGISSAFGQVA